MLRQAKLILLCVMLVLVAMVTSAQGDPNLDPVELKIMSFNIWVGGELVDFNTIVEAIEAADADIVGVQEGTGNTARLAARLGWYAHERTQIISRYPIIDPPGANGVYVLVQVRPGAVVAVMNVHLPSDPYGPYAVRDGATREEVIALEEETRLPYIQPQLEALPALLEAGMPVLLTGDFNTPSHHDWTEAVVATNPQRTLAVEWPVTVAVEAAGFVDTFRAAHPDPVENPGNTWTYGYPYPRLNDAEMIDRIDLVFAAGDVEVLASEIVGHTGTPDVDIAIENYGSDHRGVVSTVRLTPAQPPLFVAVQDRTVAPDELIVVRYAARDGESVDRIAIVPMGGAVADTLMWLPPYEASFFGSVTFGASALTPGEYEAVLFGAEDEELSRNNFWITEPGALPTISTAQATYAQGEDILVQWDHAPAMRWDWVGVWSAGDPDLYNNYWVFAYTGAAVSGELLLNSSVLGEEMLPAGDYVVRLMLDDGYSMLAEAAFTVSE
ncbi:MAG: hypothetical protein OHK0046_28180 [Anaerolineae bacterium]